MFLEGILVLMRANHVTYREKQKYFHSRKISFVWEKDEYGPKHYPLGGRIEYVSATSAFTSSAFYFRPLIEQFFSFEYYTPF